MWPTNGLPALSGEFLYVSSSNLDSIYELSINSSTGSRSYVNQFQVESPRAICGPIAIHPSNEFIFDGMLVGANGGPSSLDSLDVGDSIYSGKIFRLNKPVLVAGGAGSAAGIALDPPGRCAYVTETHGITRYSIGQHTGTVTALGDTAVGPGAAFAIAVQPNAGSVVLVTRRDDQQAYEFTTGGNCSLTANGNLLLSTQSSDAEEVAFHPALAVAYVSDPHLDTVFEIGINPPLTVSLLGAVTPPISSQYFSESAAWWFIRAATFSIPQRAHPAAQRFPNSLSTRTDC
ncbi:MAG TPA: hypothetical protein VMA09_11630 [Candidatus Binataceae bacterium]|nr:hypothetical protein [Candidatus Binataceae bacterium]